MVGGGRSTADRDAAAEALIGGDAPVVDGRREVVGKMREGEAELLVRSIEGGERRRRGFDGEVELVGAWAGVGGVLGILGRERAKGRGELVEGVLVVPLRARDWALGLCPELSTAAARVLRWVLGEEERSASCARMRRS